MSQRDADDRAEERLAAYAGGFEGSEPDLEGMFREVRDRIDRSRREPTWWLRSRPTVVRRAIAVLAFAVLATVGLLAMPRPDMGVYPMERMVASLVALGVLLVWCIHRALRPLHEPAPRRGRTWLLIGVALATALVVTVLPPAHHAHPASLGGTGDELVSRAAPCFCFGLLVGLPVYVLVWLLDRGSALSALLAAAAAGLTGNFVLQVHCPLVAPAHTTLAHFGAAVAFVVGIALFGPIERRLTAASGRKP